MTRSSRRKGARNGSSDEEDDDSIAMEEEDFDGEEEIQSGSPNDNLLEDEAVRGRECSGSDEEEEEEGDDEGEDEDQDEEAEPKFDFRDEIKQERTKEPSQRAVHQMKTRRAKLNESPHRKSKSRGAELQKHTGEEKSGGLALAKAAGSESKAGSILSNEARTPEQNLEAGQMTYFNFKDYIHETFKRIQEKKLLLNSAIPMDLIGSAGSLEEILMNLDSYINSYISRTTTLLQDQEKDILNMRMQLNNYCLHIQAVEGENSQLKMHVQVLKNQLIHEIISKNVAGNNSALSSSQGAVMGNGISSVKSGTAQGRLLVEHQIPQTYSHIHQSHQRQQQQLPQGMVVRSGSSGVQAQGQGIFGLPSGSVISGAPTVVGNPGK